MDGDGRILLGLRYPIMRAGREYYLAGFGRLGRMCRIQSVHVLQGIRPFGKLCAKMVSQRSFFDFWLRCFMIAWDRPPRGRIRGSKGQIH